MSLARSQRALLGVLLLAVTGCPGPPVRNDRVQAGDPFASILLGGPLGAHVVRVDLGDCPNCDWNTVTRRSNHRPSFEAPVPFARGTPCPLCEGVGRLQATVDWSRGYVEAVGHAGSNAVADWNVPLELERQGAYYRALAGCLRALAVSGRLLERDPLVERLPDARLLTDSRERSRRVFPAAALPDARSTKPASAHARSVAVMRVWGDRGLARRLFGPVRDRYFPVEPRLDVETAGSGPHRMLIVDARGYRVVPALYPRLVTERGDVLHDLRVLPERTVRLWGLVRYVRARVSFAELARRVPGAFVVAAHPDTRRHTSDLVVADEEARRFLSSGGSAVLDRGRVLVVVDPGRTGLP